MRRFFHLLGIGLLASVLICVALTILWYALVVICLIPFVHKSLEDTFLGRVIWFFSAALYFLYALSLPAGQIYSFWFFRPRQWHRP